MSLEDDETSCTNAVEEGVSNIRSPVNHSIPTTPALPPERRIHVAARPTEEDVPWPKPSAVYRRPAAPRLSDMRPPSSGGGPPAGPGPPSQGFLSRVADWLVGPMDDGNAGPRGPPDFLSLSEDPDKNRMQAAHRPPDAVQSAEAQWRIRCLRHARHTRLRHVDDMRIFYVEPGRLDEERTMLVVVVGAHYRSKAISQEDLMLHIVQEMEKVGQKPYVIVYFHADTRLGAVPDTDFFSGVHSALLPCHRKNLKAAYVVHPNALLKTWVLLLRLQEPEFYGKVRYVDKLEDLEALLPSYCPEPPQHVVDKDIRLGRGRRRRS